MIQFETFAKPKGQPRWSEETLLSKWRKLLEDEPHNKKTYWHNDRRIKPDISPEKEKKYAIYWEKVEPLLAKGYTYAEAGKSVGISKSMVTFIARRAGYSDARKLRTEQIRKQQARRAFKMTEAGHSVPQIAKYLRVSADTVYRRMEQYPEVGHD